MKKYLLLQKVSHEDKMKDCKVFSIVEKYKRYDDKISTYTINNE